MSLLRSFSTKTITWLVLIPCATTMHCAIESQFCHGGIQPCVNLWHASRAEQFSKSRPGTLCACLDYYQHSSTFFFCKSFAFFSLKNQWAQAQSNKKNTSLHQEAMSSIFSSSRHYSNWSSMDSTDFILYLALSMLTDSLAKEHDSFIACDY